MEAQDLSEHQWEYRLIVILIDNADQEIFKDQIDELRSEPEGLKDRKLFIYSCTPIEFRTGLDMDGKWISSEKLFKKYKKEDSNFEVILIGLDGGVKMRQSELLSCEKLFTVIDGMPMRKRELKQGNHE